MLRVFHHYISARKLGYFVAESATIALAAALGASIVSTVLRPATAQGVAAPWAFLGLALLIVALVQFALYLVDLYDLKVAVADRTRGERLLRASGAAVLVLAGLLAVISALVPGVLPGGALLGGSVGALGGLLAIRTAMPGLVGAAETVVIIGQGPAARAVARVLEEDGEDGWQPVALSSAEALQARGGLEETVRSLDARHVVLALEDGAAEGPLAGALLACRLAGCDVFDAAGFCERVLRRIPVHTLRETDLAPVGTQRQPIWRAAAKRGFDLLVASMLLVAALPLMLVVAVAIRLEGRGPIFYRQERVGFGGRPYLLWKFRSMRTDAERDGAVWARKDDDRVTRVGRFIRKTRMDEIPQVLNVLMGDMSFVGPRPERGVFVEQLKTQIPFYGLRELVKPGITGWAQIRYPYGASVEDARNKLEFDLYYVKNGSLFLDVAIIFHTVRHVLTGRGAR